MFVHVIIALCIVACVSAQCNPNPCRNGGTCSRGAGSERFVCKCTRGWDGVKCETRQQRVGCFEDKAAQRVLRKRLPDSPRTNTRNECFLRCRSDGYDYSGVEFGVECYCGNVMHGSPKNYRLPHVT